MTTLRGKVSWFGGPEDEGVAPDEGLAFIYEASEAPWLFLPQQPPGTTGLARRLDPEVHYLACRWDYSETPKETLPEMVVVVHAPKTGRTLTARPADWGPAEWTERVADLSPGLLAALEIETDDEVEIYFEPELERPMTYDTVCISSGHSTKCQGAVGPSPWGLNEVAEATRVADRVAEYLREDCDVDVSVFHDTISNDQSENLNRICSWHNERTRDLDISVHFNASSVTDDPRGVEVLYVTQEDLARRLSAAIAQAGSLKDRGPKYRNDLAFLNNTEMPAVLLEICFVDSSHDVELYRENFEVICQAIAEVISGRSIAEVPEPIEPPTDMPVVTITIRAPTGVDVRVEMEEE